MKNALYKSTSILFYVLAFFILLYFLKIRLTPNLYIETNGRMLLLFLACVFIYISGYILVKKLNYNKSVLRLNLIIYFLIYTATIFTLTLFDEIMGRRGITFINWNSNLLNLYMKYSFNLIPFKTIRLFILGYINGNVGFHSFSINIIGNLCAFMPYGIFLPLMFKSMNKTYKFIITMVVIIIFIELLQFVTMSGSCDIDDLILNVFGACIVYLICKIKFVNSLVKKILLFE